MGNSVRSYSTESHGSFRNDLSDTQIDQETLENYVNSNPAQAADYFMRYGMPVIAPGSGISETYVAAKYTGKFLYDVHNEDIETAGKNLGMKAGRKAAGSEVSDTITDFTLQSEINNEGSNRTTDESTFEATKTTINTISQKGADALDAYQRRED